MLVGPPLPFAPVLSAAGFASAHNLNVIWTCRDSRFTSSAVWSTLPSGGKKSSDDPRCVPAKMATSSAPTSLGDPDMFTLINFVCMLGTSSAANKASSDKSSSNSSGNLVFLCQAP